MVLLFYTLRNLKLHPLATCYNEKSRKYTLMYQWCELISGWLSILESWNLSVFQNRALIVNFRGIYTRINPQSYIETRRDYRFSKIFDSKSAKYLSNRLRQHLGYANIWLMVPIKQCATDVRILHYSNWCLYLFWLTH